MGEFSALLQPGRIGGLELKNRVVMPAMGTPLGDAEGSVTGAIVDFYGARARGGTGLITTQDTVVSSDSAVPHNIAIYDDKFIPGLKRLADRVHEEGGKLAIQLMHFGMLMTMTGFFGQHNNVVVPSITPRNIGDWLYREATEADIECYIQDFGEAARRAKEADADAVELHANHGCLVSAFLSPVTNRRTDQYGGSPENRLRFHLRIMERMRERVGKEFPIIVKINGTDDVDGGVTLDEVISQAVAFEAAGADAINVAAGIEIWTGISIPCFAYPDATALPYAEAVKAAVKVPVMVAGKMSPERADEVIRDGKADFVGFGRQLLADPELANKLGEGRLDDIRWCLRCGNCLRFGTGMLSCSVNPFMYREALYPPPKTSSPKKVMVIGGGVAGMQAAVTLAQRGHQVALYEKAQKLGGQMNVAAALPGKGHYKTFTDSLERLLSKDGVSVTLGTKVSKQHVQESKPDAVVVATGAVPLGLPIPGATGPNVVQANDLITGDAEVRGLVVVIGGGLLGMEVAVWLAEQGKTVSLVSDIGIGGRKGVEERFVFRALLKRLVDLRIPMYLYSPALEITEKGVIVETSGEIVSLPADTVVLSVGAEPVNGLAKELADIVPEIHVVGDCSEPRSISASTFEAAQAALQI